MLTIPNMVKVVDIQRRYRELIEAMKKDGKPVVVLNNGKPDAVVMDVATYDSFAKRVQYAEEEYFLAVAKEGIQESKAGKTKKLKKNQSLLDML